MFPNRAQVFVANEVVALERLGLGIHIFSFRKPEGAVAHERFRQIQARVSYLPDPLNRHVWRVLGANVALFLQHPARYSRTAAYVLGHTLRERNIDTWRRLLQAACLASLASDAGVQRLHAHFADGPARLAMLASMLTGIPYSFTAHARDIYRYPNIRMLREKIVAAEWVATCTSANQQYLQALAPRGERDNIKLAYHGVDLEMFSPGERMAHSAVPLILSVGRLVEKKGYPDLLHACRTLKDAGRAFRCQIFGEGPERTRLERLIADLDLHDVVSLCGTCSQEELVEQYRQAAVFVLPCRVLESGDRDGIPNVLVEAMAVGLPVISTAISGIPELIQHERNGLLVEPGDPAAIACAIERLLADSDLRQRFGAAARATTERGFDWETNAVELYRWFAADARVGPVLSR
jgi:glycosyltransferase involved in cell wall biosynthesis